MAITDNKGMFSSKTDMWGTPIEFFNKLDREFSFKIDVCAVEENAKCDKYFTPEIDGLAQDWDETSFMNPPYGREIGDWMEKAYKESVNHGSTVVALVPSRTDTQWWHNWAMKGEVRLLEGRLKFGGSTSSAPFPSAIIVFGPDAEVGKLKDYQRT